MKGAFYRKEKGFTLTELVVVIAIGAILLAIATPGIQKVMEIHRVNGAARQILNDLMHARMMASAQNNRFKVFFLDNHWYKILDDDNNNNTADDGEFYVTKDIQNSYRDVTFSATANPIFYPRGTAYGTTVTLTNPSGSKSVSVSIVGRVKIN
jgi:type IV fimbrial biogenesis protein FimT